MTTMMMMMLMGLLSRSICTVSFADAARTGGRLKMRRLSRRKRSGEPKDEARKEFTMGVAAVPSSPHISVSFLIARAADFALPLLQSTPPGTPGPSHLHRIRECKLGEMNCERVLWGSEMWRQRKR